MTPAFFPPCAQAKGSESAEKDDSIDDEYTHLYADPDFDPKPMRGDEVECDLIRVENAWKICTRAVWTHYADVCRERDQLLRELHKKELELVNARYRE